MNLDDLLKSIREEGDSKGGKVDSGKFLQSKTFQNPLKGQRFQAPGVPSRPVVIKIDPKKIIPKDTNVIGKELGEKIDELVQVIRDDNKLEEKSQKEDKKQLEAKKRKDREDRIETKKETKIFLFELNKETGKIGGFFDGLKKFLKTTLLSGLINGLYNFFTDPKNKEKIAGIQEFFRNYWPAVLGAVAYFFTPFGTLVNFVVGTVGKFLVKLGLLVAKNPILAAALAGAAGAAASAMRNEKIREQLDKEDDDSVVTPKEFSEENQRPGTFQLFDEIIRQRGFGQFFSGGGLSMGTDIVPAMLTPGEFIMSRGAVNMFGADTLMAMNEAGGGTNRPKYGKVLGYQGGGMIDKKGPKISDRDYNALLAIASLEDSDPQGRADVAQAIYNRLYSASNFGTNYHQRSNDLFSIITADGQFEPTFGNQQDWLNITDRNSAAIAIANSKKGKSARYTMQDAMKMLADTEKALSNPKLQEAARSKVGGRTFFYGTSQQKYMREDLGDVIRNRMHDNFFSMHLEEGTPYDMKRRNIGADLPQRLQPVPSPINQSKNIKLPEKSREQQIRDNFNSIRNKLSDPFDTFIRTPFRRVFPGTPNVSTETRNFVLPPVSSPQQNQSSSQTNDVPTFSVVSGNKMRDLISKDLGIHDLAGVS